MTDQGPSSKIKYEPLTNPEKPVKDQPFNFRWFKYEPQILMTVVILWATYIIYDLAKANRVAASSEKIVGLQDGYFGLQRDHNDSQWAAWRDSLTLLISLGIGHIGIGALIKKATADSLEKKGLLLFQLIYGLGLIGYLEQSGTIYWILLSGLFYLVIEITHRWKIFPFILWGMSLSTLYLNETFQGYGFSFISKELDDNMRGAPVRWYVLFNMTILRMISFGMDRYWATQQKPISQKSGEILSYRQRQETHQPLKNYNLLAYYAYLAYVPLYLTGPIISFNAWISQIYITQKEYSNKDIFKYALRYIFCFICFEVFLHLFYVNAMSTREENVHIWKKYFHQTQHILLMSMLELFFLWFKFLIIWRFARLWALLDGVESPENMNRCVANNYSFEGFWRSWHRSFNQWLIRYIFIPLGGSKYKFYNVWVVFGFVAIWHDMNLNLLLWSWIICLSLMPEMLVKFYFHQRKMRYLWDKIWFRYVAAALTTFIILAMIIANLIGYGTGRELLVKILEQVRDNREYDIVFGTFILIFCHTNVLFKLREWEAEQGKAAKF